MKSKKNVQFVHFRIRFQKFGFFLLTLSPVRYLYGFACSWANHRSLFGFFLCKQHFSVYFLNVSVCVSFVLCSLDVFCALVLWCPSCREHRRLQTIFFLFQKLYSISYFCPSVILLYLYCSRIVRIMVLSVACFNYLCTHFISFLTKKKSRIEFSFSVTFCCRL